MRSMRRVEFVPVKLSDVAEIFSVRIDNKEYTELQEFIITIRDVKEKHLHNDYEQILKSLTEISDKGAREYFFRPEGKMNDRVCAIPLLTSYRQKQKGTLRLYCIRISDKLLITGGGGIKTTRTYNEDDTLANHVKTLQMIDEKLRLLEQDGCNLPKEIYNLKLEID